MPSLMLVPRDTMKGHPATVEAYIAMAEAKAARAGRRLVTDPRTIVPCVNGGQWVFRCHHCSSYSPMDPEWSTACCFGTGCHRVYRAVALPQTSERLAIERELAERPMQRQHWGFARANARDPAGAVETVADLATEREQQRDIEEIRKDAAASVEPVRDEPVVEPERRP